MTPTRRHLLKTAGGASGLALASTVANSAPATPFKPSWESLAQSYQTPQWFRDAKLGLWSHWGPQCVPERGAWYGRDMYRQGSDDYNYHVGRWGHPSEHGFMDVIDAWKVNKWEPERLTKLYKAAGAKYLVTMANHHDNLDMFASKYHPWNTTKVGPMMDIVGTWEKAARSEGLRFGVSNHAAHGWHWFQTAYGYDAEGPLRGLRYDAYRLTKADGKGKWWDGLDPQELYIGPSGNMVAPDGIKDRNEMNRYHDLHSGPWLETVPPDNPFFVKQWLLRQNDLIDKYKPDLVYFDNYQLPLEQAGLDAVAYYYNQNIKWNKGKLEAVVNAKMLNDLQRRAITEDIERGFSDALKPIPWQTCTCIGNWHYDRRVYDNDGYKTAKDVVQRLSDIVSKNGNMLLSIPQRGNGEIDEKEEKVLNDMAAWMVVNGEAIFATRPWTIFGEGPFRAVEGEMKENANKAFTHEDIRYTTKSGTLYALVQDWPPSGFVTLRSFAESSAQRNSSVERVELLGHDGEPLRFEIGFDGLTVQLPEHQPAATPVLKLFGQNLV